MKHLITTSILKIEYQSWINNYSNGRNENDLRFGQYIHNNFITEFIINEDNPSDAYYTENATMAYHILEKILKEIINQNKDEHNIRSRN